MAGRRQHGQRLKDGAWWNYAWLRRGKFCATVSSKMWARVFWWLLGTWKHEISGHAATLQICFWISISGPGLNHYDLWKYKYMKGSSWLLRRKMDCNGKGSMYCKILINFQGKNTLNFCAKTWDELYYLSPNSVLAISVKALWAFLSDFISVTARLWH